MVSQLILKLLLRLSRLIKTFIFFHLFCLYLLYFLYVGIELLMSLENFLFFPGVWLDKPCWRHTFQFADAFIFDKLFRTEVWELRLITDYWDAAELFWETSTWDSGIESCQFVHKRSVLDYWLFAMLKVRRNILLSWVDFCSWSIPWRFRWNKWRSLFASSLYFLVRRHLTINYCISC